jgi:hypothetical protein
MPSGMILLDSDGVSFDVVYQAAGRMGGLIGNDTDDKHLYTTPYIKKILAIGVGFQDKIIRENDIEDSATMTQVLKKVGATKKEVNVKMTKAFDIEHQKRLIPVNNGKMAKNTTRSAPKVQNYDAGHRKPLGTIRKFWKKGEQGYDKQLVNKIKKYAKKNNMLNEWIDIKTIGCDFSLQAIDLNSKKVNIEGNGLIVEFVENKTGTGHDHYIRYKK